MVGYHRKSLESQIDISVLRELRSQGLTNNQIAKRLGIGVSTVYRYIGKMAMDVRKAAEQNKPCPIPVAKEASEPMEKDPEPVVGVPAKAPVTPVSEKVPVVSESAKAPVAPVSENVPAHAAPTSTLITLKEVRILDMEGLLCKYHVNQLSGDVEMVDGTVTGLLDKMSLQAFITELAEILEILSE